MKPLASYLLKLLLLAAIYVASARLGMLLTPAPSLMPLLWVPTGVSLAALLVYGPRLWPGSALGALVVAASLGAPPLAAVGISLGTTAGTVASVFLLRRLGFHLSLDRLRDVVALAVIGAGAGPLLSASIGVPALWLAGRFTSDQLGAIWMGWWWSGLISVLLISPLLLTWSVQLPMSDLAGASRRTERVVLGVGLVTVCLVIFYGVPWLREFRMAYFVFPLLIWAGIRFGPRGAAHTSVLVGLIALSATAAGLGPFARASPHEGFMDLQAFMATAALTTLMLGAIAVERTREAALARKTAVHKGAILEAALDGVVTVDSHGRILEFNSSAERLFGFHRGEVIGKEMAQLLIAPPLRESFRRGLTASPGAGGQGPAGQRVTCPALRSDRTEFPAEIGVARVAIDGPPVFTAFIRDITAQQAAERQVRQAQELLEQKVQERTANLVRVNLDLSRREEQLRQAERASSRLAAIVESSDDAIIGKTLEGTIDSWNRAAERMFGYSAQEAIGQPKSLLAAPGGKNEELQQAFARVSTGERQAPIETPMRRRDGSSFEVSATFSPILDSSGRCIGVSTIARDVSAWKEIGARLKASLQEKEVLLREIHHRVKNNLQVIASLLNLQASVVASPEARSGFFESQTRIQSMALVHQLLYQSKDLARIDFGEYLRDLVGRLAQGYGVSPQQLELSVSAADVRLDIDTSVPCGLIVNELVSNSLKHAFPDGRQGHVWISFQQDGSQLVLRVKDDGIGMAEQVRLDTVRTLGLQIVRTLSKQLRGTIELSRHGGTSFRISFPAAAPPRAAAA